ncbi:hypothetical protein OA867_03375 [Prochlorococcus sp. AH-716-D22]|nr:hypothetical protein [Prochlorococcus sp. AH-716-D22]
MNLKKVDFYLDWPGSKNIIHLRRFITENLMKKGEVIRWFIVDIKDSVESLNIKKIRIRAVLANRVNSKI